MKDENKLDFWMRCSILSGQLLTGTDQPLALLSTGKEHVLDCAVIPGEDEEINTELTRQALIQD